MQRSSVLYRLDGDAVCSIYHGARGSYPYLPSIATLLLFGNMAFPLIMLGLFLKLSFLSRSVLCSASKQVLSLFPHLKEDHLTKSIFLLLWGAIDIFQSLGRKCQYVLFRLCERVLRVDIAQRDQDQSVQVAWSVPPHVYVAQKIGHE